MRTLLIVPLPPPITGHSLVSQMLADALADVHAVDVVNLSVGSLNDGRVTARRVREVGRVLLRVWRLRKRADAIYFTISESRAGNLKDLVIYALCLSSLRRMFVHLHGGTIGRELFDRHPAWRAVNAWFIARLGGVIVSGPSHVPIFSRMIERRRIHTVPNSAEEAMFVDETDITVKFSAASPLRVLYLSAMTPEKGYLDLIDAWLCLEPDVRRRIRLDFAGRFERDDDRAAFEGRIGGLGGVHYHGLVSPEEKRRLFAEAHIFCLPTRMFEGQPISILEAYAAGCAVMTTGQPGIRDVFADGVNGFEVPEASGSGLAAVLEGAIAQIARLRDMALGNRRTAGERYRPATFTAALIRILESGGVEAR